MTDKGSVSNYVSFGNKIIDGWDIRDYTWANLKQPTPGYQAGSF